MRMTNLLNQAALDHKMNFSLNLQLFRLKMAHYEKQAYCILQAYSECVKQNWVQTTLELLSCEHS